MNITNKLNTWNEVITKANLKAKQVVDHQTAEVYFEVAKYNDNNSFVCNIVKKIFKNTGVDLRFSFVNINSVIFTSKNFNELEDFITSMTFDLVDENFIYQQTSIAAYKNKSFLRGAIVDLDAHGIDFSVVHSTAFEEASSTHVADFPSSRKSGLADKAIVGPGIVIITSDNEGKALLSLAKKTVAHINSIKNK